MVEPKGKTAAEAAADRARKKAVDTRNEKEIKTQEKAETELADTPLNAKELAFITRIKPMLNYGRAIDQPSPAEILRYSQLIKRKDVE